MRLAALHLRPFAAFADLRLEFGDRPGLHVVHGPNEAGKSTVLRALRALWFGFPHTASDAGAFAPRDLRVAGTLVDDEGRSFHVVRRRGRVRTLLDAQGEALDDDWMSRWFGEVDAELFRRLYTFDGDELSDGSDELLRNEGGVGLGLLRARTGLTHLRTAAETLRKRADVRYRPRARKGGVPEALAAWEAHTAAARDASLSTERWQEWTGEFASVEARRAEAAEALARWDQRVARHETLARLRRLVALRDEATAALAKEGDGPVMPPDAVVRRREAEALQASAEAAKAALVADIRRVEAALADVPRRREDSAGRTVRRAVLDRAAVVERARHEREALRRERAALEELPDALPDDVVWPDDAATLAAWSDEAAPRIRDVEDATRRLESAGEERTRAIREARALRTRRAEWRPSAAETALAAWWDAKGAGSEVERDASEARRRLDASRARVAHLRKQLAASGLEGDDELLSVVPWPSDERLAASGRARREAHEALQQARRVRTEAEEAVERASVRLESLGDEEEVTPEDVERARHARDEQWQALVDGWREADEASSPDPWDAEAERYAELVKDADGLADTRARQAEGRAIRRRAREGWRDARRHRDQAREAEREAQQASDAADAAWSLPWEQWGLEVVDLEQARRIAGALAAMSDARTELTRDESSWGAARDARSQRRRTLREAMVAAGLIHAGRVDGRADREVEDHDAFNADLECARAWRLEHQERLGRREARQRDLELLGTRRRALRQAHRSAIREHGVAREAWRDWADSRGLRELPMTRVRASLEAAKARATALARSRALEARIAALDAEIGAFDSEVACLVSRSPEAFEGARAEDVASRLRSLDAWHQAHEAARATRHRLLIQCRALRREWRARAVDGRRADAALTELTKAWGAASREALPALEARAERVAEVARRRSEAEAEIEALVGEDAASWWGAVEDAGKEDGDDGAERETLAAGRAEAARACEVLDRERGRLDEVRARLEDEVGAAASVEDAAESLAALRHEVEQFVLEWLAVRVIERRVAKEQESHREPLLDRAGEALSAMTEGVYRGVRTEADEAGTLVLRLEKADGRRVGVDVLSSGTRDQLYLALRLAALDETPNRLPLVCDDILVHFDDARAMRTLARLAECGHDRQVLFFTHHERLVELAHEAAPGRVHSHALPGPARAARGGSSGR